MRRLHSLGSVLGGTCTGAGRLGLVVVAAGLVAACGGSNRRAAAPHAASHSETTLTAATMGARIERLVVAERGSISMVARNGCLATVTSSEGEVGGRDELRVRCPKPDRMKAWFEGTDRVTDAVALEPVRDEEEGEESDVKLPAAKVLTSGGKAMRVAKRADVDNLIAQVRALAAELASAEDVAPGPATANGWQMLHVMGPARVVFAGTPARGVFEARMSTNGQYMCEFVTNVEASPIRATKSGYLTPATASRAIDEVLGPFNAAGAGERGKMTFAAGTKGGTEQRSNAVSTVAVLERFAEVQDALGDACLPELETPSAGQVGL